MVPVSFHDMMVHHEDAKTTVHESRRSETVHRHYQEAQLLLIRGIQGEDFAKDINRGLVGCRDLVSLVSSENQTGYKFSAYNEPVYKLARNKRLKVFMPRDTPEPLRDLVRTYLDEYTFETYMTFFHIVSPGVTEKWLSNSGWDENTRFIYYEPKFPLPDSSSVLGLNYCGGKMNYVRSQHDISDQDTLLQNPCLTVLFDWESYRCTNGPTKEEHLSRFNHLVVPLLNRVVDEQFTDKENEFRVIVRTPRMLFSDGHTEYCVSHPQRVHIDGNPYKVVRTMHGYATDKLGIQPIDLRFVPENPRLRKLELLDVVDKGLEVTPISEFESINISDTAIRYGYIGDLERCKSFVQRELNESRPLPQEDENNHYFHGNWDDYRYVVERHRTWDEIKGGYRPTGKGFYD